MRIGIRLSGPLAEWPLVKLPDNGNIDLTDTSCVQDALLAIGANELPLLVLVNGQRARTGQLLQDGDLLELVQLIGGG